MTYDWTRLEMHPYTPTIVCYHDMVGEDVIGIGKWFEDIIKYTLKVMSVTSPISRPIPAKFTEPRFIDLAEYKTNAFVPSHGGVFNPLYVLPGCSGNWLFNAENVATPEHPIGGLGLHTTLRDTTHRVVKDNKCPVFGICGGYQLLRGAMNPQLFVEIQHCMGEYATYDRRPSEHFQAQYEHRYAITHNHNTFYSAGRIQKHKNGELTTVAIDSGGFCGPTLQQAGGVQFHPEWSPSNSKANEKALSILYHTIRFSEKLRGINYV